MRETINISISKENHTWLLNMKLIEQESFNSVLNRIREKHKK